MTNAAVERSDSQRSQRSQGNNGPRVSFNRDVHVKRIDLNPDRFHSLPSRKKHSPLAATTTTTTPTSVTRGSAAIGRSASDASAKKSKKPSIFSLFSGRRPAAASSDAAAEAAHHAVTPTVSGGNAETKWKRIGRSRSDVGTAGGAARPTLDGATVGGIRKRNNSETESDSLPGKKKSVPLSPIIENPQRQSYFGGTDVTTASKAPATSSSEGIVPAGNIGYTHLADLDQVPSKPTSTTALNGDTMHVHSSQKPADRLPLTKGVTVDGIVKRLSAERFSPVPHLQGPAFSYTRPNDSKIVYAQMLKDIEANRPTSPTRYAYQTNGVRESTPVHQQLNRSSMSPPQRLYANTSNDEERPIVPIIRRVDYHYPEMVALSNRRQQLESRLNSRRIGSAEQLDPVTVVVRAPSVNRQPPTNINRYVAADETPLYGTRPECPPRRRWRAKSAERERQPYIEDCIDEPDDALEFGRRSAAVAPRRQTTAAPNSGGGGFIDLGYIEDLHIDPDTDTMFHQNKYREQYRQEFEPQSLDSQFGESLEPPSSHQHQQRSVSPIPQSTPLRSPTATTTANLMTASTPLSRHEYRYPEQVHTLRREPKTQHSFDRGADSGIERDYPKSSASPGAADTDFSTITGGSRTWKSNRSSMPLLYGNDDTVDMDADLRHWTEVFLRRERQHCERLQAQRHSHIFRERSIDDGSHYDPRLDKYPNYAAETASYRKYPTIDHNANHTKTTPTTTRGEKKLSGLIGFDKVKQLFGGKKKSNASTPAATGTSHKRDKEKHVRREDEARHSQQSSSSSKSTTGNYNGLSILREPKLSDIATRRRLSTPKASPLPSRAPSTTHYHQQHHHQHLHQPHSHPNHNANTSTLSKSSSSRTSGATSGVTTTASPSARPAVPNRRPVAVPPKKSAWYRSLERLTSPMKLHHKATSSTPTMRLSQSTSTLNKDSRSNGRLQHGASNANGWTRNAPLQHHQSHQQLHSYPHKYGSPASSGISQENLAPAKSLRFFGDTDLDSNPPTLSKGHSMSTLPRKRTPLAGILTTSGGAQAPGVVGSLPPAKPARSGGARNKEFRTSTKHLHNISESASYVDETDRAYGTNNHHKRMNQNGSSSNGSDSNHAAAATTTTVNDLRTALKARSRSSPVRRAADHHHSIDRGNGHFQRGANVDDIIVGDDGVHHYRSNSDQEQHRRRRSRSPSAGGFEHRKPPTGSQQLHQQQQRKSATRSLNTIDRRAAHSRDHERAIDSSGTDSSQHSVVYLHATTVGAIPQPYVLQSRRTRSREELSSARSSSLTGAGTATTLKSSKTNKKARQQQQQPMTRSVSRSLSLLAPWSPRHIRDGYEIDYAADQQQQTLPNKHQHQHLPRTATPDRTMARKYHSHHNAPDTVSGHDAADRRPTAMLQHYREQDMRRETVSIPSRR